MREQPQMGKGLAKVSKNDRVFKGRDTLTGKRLVRVNENTWVYTSCDTDEQAIEKYNKLHGVL